MVEVDSVCQGVYVGILSVPGVGHEYLRLIAHVLSRLAGSQAIFMLVTFHNDQQQG